MSTQRRLLVMEDVHIHQGYLNVCDTHCRIADYTMGECQQCCNCRHEAEHVGTTLEVDELTSNNKNKSIKYSSHHVIRLFWHTRCDSLDDDIMTVIRT